MTPNIACRNTISPISSLKRQLSDITLKQQQLEWIIETRFGQHINIYLKIVT